MSTTTGNCPVCGLRFELIYDKPYDVFEVPLHWNGDQYCDGSYKLPSFFTVEIGESTGKSLQGGPDDPVRKITLIG